MKLSGWRVSAIVSAVVFAGFSGAHLIDEFVWGAPAEFHLAVAATEILALGYMTALIGLIASAAAGRRAGYLGLAIAGGLIFVADILKHGPDVVAPGPWRFPVVSGVLVVGLTLSGLCTAASGLGAWRASRRA